MPDGELGDYCNCTSASPVTNTLDDSRDPVRLLFFMPGGALPALFALVRSCRLWEFEPEE